VRTALETQINIAGQFATLATLATETDDQRSREFLQWFVDEQIDDECMMRKLLALAESGIELVDTEMLSGSDVTASVEVRRATRKRRVRRPR
jgi:ferritin